MKKGIILIGLLLLTACSHKPKEISLRCEKSEVVSENTMNEVIVATFKDDLAQNADIKLEIVVNEKYVTYMDTLVESINNNYSEYYNKSGIDINVAVGTDTINVKMNIDFNNLDDASKQIVGLNNPISTYEETKEILEKNGYTCKM